MKAIKVADGVVNYTLLVVFVALIAFAGYALWDTRQILGAADKSNYEIYKPVGENEGMTFKELQALNPEVIAWIEVYGTNIDYPVTQGRDNIKYVNTNALGLYSLSGAIFLDAYNSEDFSDFNSFLYGHHMEKDVLFGQIGRFSDKGVFDSHRYGNLYFGGKDHGIEFFAFLYADAYDRTVFTTKASGNATDTAVIKTADSAAERTVEKAIDTSADKATDTTSYKKADKVIDKTADDAAERTVEKAIDTSSDKATDTTSYKKADKVIDKTAYIKTDKAAGTTAEIAADNTSENAITIAAGKGAENERTIYLKNMLEKAVNTRDVKISDTDNLILLVTCSTDSTNGRDILVGRISEEVFADPFKIAASEGGKNRGEADAYRSTNKAILGMLAVLILLAIMVILLISFMIRWRKETASSLRAPHSGQRGASATKPRSNPPGSPRDSSPICHRDETNL